MESTNIKIIESTCSIVNQSLIDMMIWKGDGGSRRTEPQQPDQKRAPALVRSHLAYCRRCDLAMKHQASTDSSFVVLQVGDRHPRDN